MPKSLEQLNDSLQESISKPENESTYEAEVVLSPELKSLSNTLNEVQEAIEENKDLKAEDLLSLKEAVGKIKVEIGGEEFTLKEVKDIENLKENVKIWQEMEVGDFSNTHKLTILSKRAKEIITNYTGENLNLCNLISAKHLILPDSIEGWLDLRSLTSAEHLTLPDSIGGTLNLGGLTSAKDLILPNHVSGNLFLSRLKSAKDLSLPNSIGGYLNLNGLTSAKDLKLPDSIGDSLLLSGLTSAKDLKLPDSIGGSLDLDGITSAKDLTLPHSLGGELYLNGLKSTKHLKLPDFIGCDIYLIGLPPAEKEELKKKYTQHARKII